MPDDQLIADLRALVGDWGVVTGELLRARTYDEPAGEVRARVLVRPRDTAQERCVYEPLRSIAGSISAEHGIGLERKAYLEISRSPAEIATMRALKAALDPRGILNPGKVFDVEPA